MVMVEGLAVGEMMFEKKCLGKMGDAAQNEGKTVLYVSHNMATIRNLCTRCVVLDKGRIIFNGDVERAINVYMDSCSGDLLTKYDFENTKSHSPIRGMAPKIQRICFVAKTLAAFLEEQRPMLKSPSTWNTSTVRLWAFLK